MPITCQRPLRPLSKKEFGEISYAVMGDLFKVHGELGRFFDEKIYKRALATLRKDIELEVAVDVTYRTFAKRYFLDVLVAGGALLELKAAEAFTPRHRAQLLHYLLLTELLHGLLVNVRLEQIDREFVNVAITREDRFSFSICDSDWESAVPGADVFREVLQALLKEWGTCLDLSLYEEALTHFLGGEETVIRPVEVTLGGRSINECCKR